MFAFADDSTCARDNQSEHSSSLFAENCCNAAQRHTGMKSSVRMDGFYLLWLSMLNFTFSLSLFKGLKHFDWWRKGLEGQASVWTSFIELFVFLPIALPFSGTLNVLLRVRSIASVDSVVWTKSGHQGPDWKRALFDVSPSGPFQVTHHWDLFLD